jgi:membrane-associated phospholipid phosphatase
VILLAGDFDHEISEWAVERQPLFGRDAESASYDLRDATTAAWLVTLLAADSGGADFGETIRNKGAAAAVELAAVGVSEGLTWGLKEATGRERPNGANDKSFVSGHASAAATRAALAARNLDHVDLPDWGRTGLKIGFHALALGSAWARVEAEKHYPSDVLAGAALGNFVANFMVNAFLEPGDAVISVTPLDGGAMFTLKSRF